MSLNDDDGMSEMGEGLENVMEDNSPSRECSPIQSAVADDQACNLCQRQYDQPRVLSCLHVFCQSCLEKLLEENEEDDHASPLNYLKCPDCNQETRLTQKGVSGLPLDHVLCNQLDMLAIESMQILCTSCKAKEKAVARCSDCANFLCPNCVSAHQYMRCFENHKVVTFEEMQTSGDGLSIHKPITCSSHAGESLKYYCYTCQLAICNECLVNEHKQPEHRYERAVEAEPKQREELETLVGESKSKVEFCEEATNTLQNSLSELQMKRDDAKGLIEETFQSYKAFLEKRQTLLLEELSGIHSRQEIQIMETFYNVEKTIEKIEDACKFAQKLLKHGNAVEMLSLKNMVGSQLLYLINNTPKPDVNVDLRFETDSDKFEKFLQLHFGRLIQGSSPPKGMSEDSNAKGSTTDTPLSPHHSSPHHSSPLHSTSSFDSDHFALPVGVLSPETDSLPSLDVDLSNNMAQYNLAQLAGMAAHQRGGGANNMTHGDRDTNSPTCISGNPIVGGSRRSQSSSPAPPLTLSDLLINTSSNDLVAQINALNNLSALAKLGSVSLSSLTMDPVGSHARASSSASGSIPGSAGMSQQGMRVIQSSPIDSALGSLMNGGRSSSSGGMSSTPQRVTSPPPLDGHIGNGINLNLGLSRVMTPISSQSSSSCSYNPPPRSTTNKLNTMQIRCKFGQLGASKGQFSSPHGFCLGIDEEIIVADTNNHRIQVFDKIGEFKFQFGIPGKEEGQLWYPRKVAVIRKTGKFVICDRGNERSRMQIFTKTGHFVKKIAIRYIDIVAGLAITTEGHIVAVDSVSPTVFVISEAGDLLHWFDCSEYMREPSDIAISNKEYYICDFKGHCVIVFNEEGHFQHRIGCENITNFPNGIDISDAGDVLVGDSHGNRFHVVVFSREGSILSEFECPYVKVSRCCGLKITSEGYIVTLAKNNHHVLILNTLYIT